MKPWIAHALTPEEFREKLLVEVHDFVRQVVIPTEAVRAHLHEHCTEDRCLHDHPDLN